MSKQARIKRRREERLERERAEAARALRARRLRRLGAATLAAATLAVAAALVSSAGGSQAPKPRTHESALFAGLTERAGVLGDPAAPLVVTEYLDLQCPSCARAAGSTLPMLVRDYVRTGKVRLEARTLHFLGPDSERGARMAAGAERQGRLWPFLEAFYASQGPENSGYVTDEFLADVARAARVDLDGALADADSEFAERRLTRAGDDAARMGVTGTPTLTVRGGGGHERLLDANPMDPGSVAAVLDRELRR